MDMNYGWYNDLYTIVQVGNAVEQLPANASIVSSVGIPIQYYANFRQVSDSIGMYGVQCNQIPNDTYIVHLVNETFQYECGLTLAFASPPKPAWVANYSLYSNQFMNFSAVRLYFKK